MSQVMDLTGQRYGKLIVISQGPMTKHKKARWNCKCDCGGTKTVCASDLRNGATKSCGCLAKEVHALRGVHKRKLRPPGSSAIRELFSRYKRTAKIHGRDFLLSKEEFLTLITSNCHYCNKPPSQEIFSGWRATYNEGFKYSGIDRKQNQFGYVLSNCVSACVVCNLGKHTMSYEDYIDYLNNLVKYRGAL